MISKIFAVLQLKGTLIVVGGVVGALVLVFLLTRWITTGQVEAAKDAEWELRIATAPEKVTYVDRTITIPGRQVTLPGETVVMTVEDSGKVRELLASIDNKDSLIYELKRTKKTTDEDTVATVFVWYNPIGDYFQIWREYKPFSVSEKTITKMRKSVSICTRNSKNEMRNIHAVLP